MQFEMFNNAIEETGSANSFCLLNITISGSLRTFNIFLYIARY